MRIRAQLVGGLLIVIGCQETGPRVPPNALATAPTQPERLVQPTTSPVPARLESVTAHVEMRRPSVRGNLNRAAVTRAVRNRIGDIKFCHQQAIARGNGSDGMLTLDFHIEPDGTLAQARILGSTIEDPRLGHCVLDAAQSVRFPRTRDDKPARVTYPITFGEPDQPTPDEAPETDG